jgi:Protein of unknown function (DUF3575)
MRKIQLLAVMILLGASQAAFAQKSALKINLLSPVARTLNLAFEQTISENSSLQLGFYYTGAKASDVKLRGYGITPEFRYYLSSTPAPAGFYIAPFLRYSSYTLSAPDGNGQTDEATLSNFGGGLVVGKQWLFKERVTLDMFIGPRYLSGDVKVKAGSSQDSFSTGLFNGFGLRGGITLGVAF